VDGVMGMFVTEDAWQTLLRFPGSTFWFLDFPVLGLIVHET